MTNLLDEEYFGTISSGIGANPQCINSVTGVTAPCVNSTGVVQTAVRLLLDRSAAHRDAVVQVQLLSVAQTCAASSHLLAAAGTLPAAAADRPPGLIRIATFNCSLNRASAGELRRDLATPDNAQARAVAEIIQRVRPDILLLQEFDYDAAGEALRAFQANYLARPQNGAAPHRVRATPSSPSRTPAVRPASI